MKIKKGGTLVLPAKVRKALRIKTGDEVVRKYVPEGVSLVDELIQARREEAKRE
jgi:bifunctional DNA-binding transcriptional regulator/antitoxin component of YhaV-PrlF toxin-antitoxin module